jgi:predicted dehydrogenase
MSVRVGLVGTGTWARRVHAPALAGAPDAELVGVWGRSPEAREELAADFGARAFDDLDALAEAVDVVAFAVPPAVQAALAPRAAAHGRRLLLEKPLASTVAEAEHVATAIRAAGVGAVVFVTRLFDPVRLAWLREQREAGPTVAHAEFVSAALSIGAYRDSTWRQVSGALWDVGPHVLSQLEAVLGPVDAVAVDEAVPGGDVRLRFEHRGGTSSAHLNLHADEDRLVEWIRFAGDGPVSPPAGASYPESYERALAELLAPSGDPLLAGATAEAGVGTVRVLAAASALIAAGDLGRFDAIREPA